MSEVLKKGVQKLMECPVCLETPQFTPIYRCGAGHILCKDCRGKVQNCPICKVELGGERCLLAEQLLYQLPARCRFFASDCKREFLDREDLKNHQLECPHRPVRCISLFCKRNIQIAKLAEHLKEDHRCGGPEALPHTGTVFVSEDIIKKDMCWCWMTYFCTEGNNFFSVIARSKGGLWYSWVYMSSTKRGIPFKYKFLIPSNDGQRAVSYYGECLSVDDHPVDSMAKICSPAPKLIFDDTIVYRFAAKANPEKVGIPGEGNMILRYQVDIGGSMIAVSQSKIISHLGVGDGQTCASKGSNQQDVPQIESKLNMW